MFTVDIRSRVRARPGQLRVVEERLALAGCVAADEEAPELVAAAAGTGQLEQWLLRREAGEPLAWLVGSLEFAGLRVLVTPGVYVPRHQSELLAGEATAALGASRRGRALDACTGCGAIAVALQASVPGATVVGVDIDRAAVACAATNGVRSVQADTRLPVAPGTLDVVTAVAPYVPTDELAYLPADVRRWEPVRALDGGGDGLDVIRRLVRAAAEALAPGGWLLLELGGDQDERLARELARCFGPVRTWRDDEGDLRGLAAPRA